MSGAPLSGPLAVVTGAGAGIGAAISRELARRGLAVVPTDLDEAAAARTAQQCDSPASYRLDVTDEKSIAHAVELLSTRHGPPSVWVSNAGVSKMQPFLEITAADFDFTLGVNLRGLFLASQAAARLMVEGGGGGCIVNVASMAGKQGRVPFLADYVASKFGVVGLTQAMAFELAEHGIRVNSVCPGYVATSMQERELAWEARLRRTSVEAVRALYLADTPMRRIESPEDVARVVAFLVSEDASFVTGEAVAVNGGAFMD
jgi:meso-butanediol dehydrogenase/(S,S)-butanediol dehydrogenase/diacetyl reductase